METVLQGAFAAAQQFQAGLVDDDRSLECGVGDAPAHIALGHLPQLPVHQRDQLVERGGIALAPLVEVLDDFVLGGGHGSPLTSITLGGK